MKKIFISSILLCFFVSNFAFSQSITIDPADQSEILVRQKDTGIPSFVGKHSRVGATPALSVSTASNTLLRIGAQGYNGTAFTDNVVQINFSPTQSFTSTATGTKITFHTTEDGTTNTAEKMRIDNNGNVGIGVTAPTTRLELDGASNNGTTGTLKISNGTANFMLFDGDEIDAVASDLRLNSNSPSNVFIGNGGGYVGIGTTLPLTKLHVKTGVSGVTPHANAKAFIEGSEATYLNIAAPDASDTGVLFGKTTNAAHGGIIYTNNNNMLLRTGGNQTRMTILSDGKVGIGTTSPDTKLHIDGDENDGTTAALKITSGSQNMLLDGNEIDVASNGSIFINNNSSGGVYLAGGGGGVRVGANGTGISEIIRATVNIPSFSVGANTCIAPSFTITDAALNSTVHVSPELSLSGGLLIAYVRVTSLGNLLMRVCNVTNASVTQSAIDYHFTIIR